MIGELCHADALRLGIPVRIEGDVIEIHFRGRGEADFKLQHTGDDQGAPVDLGWCDVSMMNNASISPMRALLETDRDGLSRVSGLLVERIAGDTDIRYRRFTAGWLRLLPLEDGEENLRKCESYTVTLQAA